MKPSHSAPVAVGASRPWRRPYIALPAVALAAAGLAVPAIHLTRSDDRPQPIVSAAAVAAEAAADRPSTKAPASEPATAETATVKPAPVEKDAERIAGAPAEDRADRVTTGSVPPAAPVEPTPLSENDPRWGPAALPADDAPVSPRTAELRSRLEALEPDPDAPAADPAPAARAPEPARSRAAAPDVTAAAPVAALAESEPATSAPSVLSRGASGKTAAAMPGPNAGAEQDAPPADIRTARTTSFVNMRSGPQNEASVLTVLPKDAEIAVVGDCIHWCEVTYEGRRGYVYKSFISET